MLTSTLALLQVLLGLVFDGELQMCVLSFRLQLYVRPSGEQCSAPVPSRQPWPPTTEEICLEFLPTSKTAAAAENTEEGD